MTQSLYTPQNRVRRAFAVATAFVVLLLLLAVDATQRRTAFDEGRPRAREVVRQLGFADLALSSSARWLRTPTQTERSAPLTDAPLSFDTDPAGAVLGPVE